MSNDNNRHRAIYSLATKYFIRYSRIIYKEFVSCGGTHDITRFYEWTIYSYYRKARSRAIKRSKEKPDAKSYKLLEEKITKDNVEKSNS